ncbi:MAG: hypothetical protein R3E66_02975 [bacterium]
MRLSVLKVMLLAWATFAIACGDDSTKPTNKCAGVTCETGVCDANTGTCVNECDTTEDCAEGVCDNGTCVQDLCVDVTCPRGVCAVATGECVNATVCTNETEATDCVEGYGCYGQRCVTEAEYCETQTCARGVCSLAAKGCANAASCTMDSECLEGSFCENGTCSANRCDANMVMCDRGVCEGTTGECVNATTCSSGAECVDNFYCVDGACTEVDQACAGCEGNQVCAYDQGTTVTCEESPAGCNNTFDCLGDRVCDSGSCVAPGTCAADALEPFDQAAPYALDDNSGVVSASLCANDEDAFTYDVANAAQFTGTLVALVNVDAEDVGRGEVAVELLDDAGTSIASGTTVNGVARLTTTIGNLNRGIYTLVVTPSGALSSAGLSYTVFMNL